MEQINPDYIPSLGSLMGSQMDALLIAVQIFVECPIFALSSIVKQTKRTDL